MLVQIQHQVQTKHQNLMVSCLLGLPCWCWCLNKLELEYEVTGLCFCNNSHPLHLSLKPWQKEVSKSRDDAMLVLF